VSEISQSIKSLEIKFQDENFTLYSDSISQEADFGNLYNGVFGKLFGNIKGSSKKLATIQDGGNYIRIGVDSEHTISVNTDSYCRIDIYFIETKDLIAFSNDFSLIDSLLNEYSNLDQISLAHSLSIYGNRPPKKGTFFTEIKRLGYRQKLIIKENILIIEDSIPQIKKINTDKKETEFLNEYYETFKDKGIKNCYNTPYLEDNHAIINIWKHFDPVVFRKRRTYIKNL
jgi:hypothetical protein